MPISLEECKHNQRYEKEDAYKIEPVCVWVIGDILV